MEIRIQKIISDFKNITDIDVVYKIMFKGKDHKPTSLSKGYCGVYVFFNEDTCFKVGKAGTKSQARWNSHHYNLDNSTPSTLPKSIITKKDLFKSKFPSDKHIEIDGLSKANIKKWIKNNLSRIEFTMKYEENHYGLALLEALVQFSFKPIFEGRQKD